MHFFSLGACNFVDVFPIWVINFTSIVYFELSQNSFTGEIPMEIGQLSENLANLALAGMKLSGQIPPSIVNCTNLMVLELAYNEMTGDILSDIGLLSNIEELHLEQNNFSGSIPSSISNCSALSHLDLGYSPMSRQTVPTWIASLSNLQYLYIPMMNLYGEIPTNLGQLSNLRGLGMYSNSLGGVLPPSLGNLSFLSFLSLNSNQFHGEIPHEITGNLSSLTFLQLSFNCFVGSLPKLTALIELETFQIDGNLLTGNIDSHLGAAAAAPLVYVTMSLNNFSGPMPKMTGNVSNLQGLDLSYNSFSGSIPPYWGNLTKLGYLILDDNQLEGVLPMTLTSCTHLLELGLASNTFEGFIPQDIGQLVNLVALNLEKNFLSGSLPSSFANLTKVRTVILGQNRFSGGISGDMLSRIALSLVWLDVSHNFVSGPLPAELQLLTNLQHLDISTNMMSGSLELGLARCIGLAYLDVSNNNFTGKLPADLALLPHLQFFNASVNNFDGPIPSSGPFFSQNVTRYSFLDNPGLCGSTLLVSQQCTQLSVSGHHHCKNFDCKGAWIAVAVSIPAFLFLVMVIVICWWVMPSHEKTGQHMIPEFTLQGWIALSEQDLHRIIEGGEDNVIGMGAKSIVYKGVLSGGEIVALKVLRNEDTEIDGNVNIDKREELLREVKALAQLRHVNIIKVLGLSVTPNVKALILEYMPCGSLHDLLYSHEEVCKLSHQERLKIILGIAEALVYLHHSFHEPIIHRDLKPSNILLGMDLQPKLGDFGISKFARFQTNGELEASASTICGTFGYMPPEYASQSTVSAKGEVYSFGVVLLELLTGRKPASESSSMASGDLVEFVLRSFKQKPFQLLDSILMEEGKVNPISENQLMLLLRVGVLCTRPIPKSRPNMNDVLEMLKQIEDVGSENRALKTVQELSHENTIWDPDSTQEFGDQLAVLSL